VLQAWYPGIKGGQAISDILFGDVNPSGRLPITFPASLNQIPRPQLDGLYENDTSNLHVDYNIEGSDVGYRWYHRKGITPLFAFGYGLSYTSFQYDQLSVKADRTLHIRFRVTNTGQRQGRDTPQLYVTSRAGVEGQRLIGWAKVDLLAGQSQLVNVDVDPRLLADWSIERHGWEIKGGSYEITLNSSALYVEAHTQADLSEEFLAP
jgi:beta-glucosidase